MINILFCLLKRIKYKPDDLTGSGVMCFVAVWLLLISVIVAPARSADNIDSLSITDSALKCGAIYFLLDTLSDSQQSDALLVSYLDRLMAGIYAVHYRKETGNLLTKMDIAQSRDQALADLTERYEGDPLSVAGDFLWCDAWHLIIKKYNNNSTTVLMSDTMLQAVPAPPLHSSFDREVPNDVPELLSKIFPAWSIRGKPTPAATELKAIANQIVRACVHAWPKGMLDKLMDLPGQEEISPPLETRFLQQKITLDKGYFYPTRLDDVLGPMLEYVGSGQRFLDLGSGDGRIVFLANVLGADATGVEYDEKLFRISLKARDSLKEILVPDRLRIIQDDFFNFSWSDYDVIFYFELGSYDQNRIRRKLFDELAPTATLIIYHLSESFPGMSIIHNDPAVTVLRNTSAM